MNFMWYLNGISTAVFTDREKGEEYIKREAEENGVTLVERKRKETFSIFDYEYASGEIDVICLSMLPVDPVYGLEID